MLFTNLNTTKYVTPYIKTLKLLSFARWIPRNGITESKHYILTLYIKLSYLGRTGTDLSW